MMGLRLNFTALLAVSGLMLSSAAAQQPQEKPKELDILRQYVGDWTSDVTSKPAVWTPEEKKFRTSNHAEFVLDGWFLNHIEVNHVVGDPEKVTKALMISTYDRQAKKYGMWFFQSTGIIGKSVGTWNQENKSLSYTPTELPPNATSKHTEAFPNDSTIDGTLSYTGNDGQKMFDMVWTRKRQPGVAGKPTLEQWAEIGSPIQPIPEEVKKLEPLVGTWDSEYVFQVPQRPAVKGVISDEWALDGRFIMRRETVGSTKSIAMIGWDDNKRAYRIARAISNGRTNEAIGQWNDATRSLVWNWKMPDDSEGVTAIATWRFVGKDAVQIHVVHDNENVVLLDLTINMKRRKRLQDGDVKRPPQDKTSKLSGQEKLSADNPISPMKLLAGYKQERLKSDDTDYGRIFKKGGADFEYDIGPGAFNPNEFASPQEEVQWSKTQFTATGKKVYIELRKDGIVNVFFPESITRFSGRVRGPEDIADILLMVMTF